jgi:hypothetical protein
MTRIFLKIVNNFDDEWMRVLFHEPDFLQHSLMLSYFQEFHRSHRSFDSEYFLIMLPNGPENLGEATLSDKVILVSFIQVGVLALLGNSTYLRFMYSYLFAIYYKLTIIIITTQIFHC